MKLIVKDKELCLISEGEAEQRKLTEVFIGHFLKNNKEDVVPTGTARKRKKHAFKKQCSDCPKTFKGAIGLGIHRARMHKKDPSELRPLPVTEG